MKVLFTVNYSRNTKRQESPPAWTQEAYRPPCSEYSFCCPTWVPPLGYPVRYPWGGTQTPPGVPGPPGGTQSGTPPGVPGPPRGTRSGTPPGGVPSQVPPGGPGGTQSGTPLWGTRTPRGGTQSGTPRGGGGTWPGPPRCLMAFWEMLQSIMGYGYPPCGQTDWWMDRRVSKHYLPSYYVRGR